MCTEKNTERAENVWQSLQTRARNLIEAEEGLVATVRTMIEEQGWVPGDVKLRLDDAMGRIRSNELWDNISTSDTVATLTDYREELERRVEEIVKRLFATLQIATQDDIAALEKKHKSLNRKVNELNRKLKALSEA